MCGVDRAAAAVRSAQNSLARSPPTAAHRRPPPVTSASPGAGILPTVTHPFAYLDAPAPLAFAHRGGAAHGDENTAEAFARAVALGYRYVETDVHATADGVAVAFHDPTLERVTGEKGRIDGLRWADLASVRVGGAAAVPRLDDVLAAWPQVRFNIDVKAAGGIDPTVDTVQRTGAAERVLLASFNDGRLQRLRALAGPKVATSLGMRGVARLWLASRTGRAVRIPPTVVAAQVPSATAASGWSTAGSSVTRTGSGCRCTSGRSTNPPRCTTYSTWAWMAS